MSPTVIPMASRNPDRSSVLSPPATDAPTTAMPSRPATRATALFTPLAMPASLSSASASTVAVSGATISDRPTEKTSERRQELRPVVEAGLQPDERARAPPPRSSGPLPMKRRGPKRIDSRPTRGDRTNMTTVIGTSASPTSEPSSPASCCTKSTRKNVSVDSPA